MAASEWPLALQLLLVLSAAAVDDLQQPCPMDLSEPAPAGARVMGGMLYAGQPERQYLPSQYRAAPGGGYRLCTCELKQCILKCCEPGQAFVEKKCNSFDELRGDFKVPKSVTGNRTAEAPEAHDLDKFHVHYQLPQCPKRYKLYPYKQSDETFHISADGILLSGPLVVPRGQFCFELLQANSGFQYLAVVCATNVEIPGLNRTVVSALIISIPFLFITLLVYAFTKKLRDLHGKCFICHVLSLLMAYISEIIIQLYSSEVIKYCVILGYSSQFFALACFFWLNVMCIDLWYIFRNGRKLEKESEQFKMYSVYAWGCSCLISIIIFVSDKWHHLMTFLPKPLNRQGTCGIINYKALALYFYGPITVILFVNALIFIRIAILILACKRRNPESHRNLIDHKQKLILCVELFIVMGLNWTAEIISWKMSNSLKDLWFITDIGNALQGVLIFVIFVCRERVLKMLNLQCCPRLRLFESSGPVLRQPNLVNDASSNPTVTCQLYDINFTDENHIINQQNEVSHLVNGCNPE